MRAGRLDRTIQLLNAVRGEPDRYGNTPVTWEPAGTFRAAIVTVSTEEFLRAYGQTSETAIVFRTRFIASASTAHRVRFEGQTYEVKELSEIGRRNGLEWRCIGALR